MEPGTHTPEPPARPLGPPPDQPRPPRQPVVEPAVERDEPEDEEIDTSDIPEMGEEWFQKAHLRLPTQEKPK